MNTTNTVTKKRVLIETRVIVEPGRYYGYSDPERNRQRLERWARELMEFFRDHRSMDVNAVYAEPRYELQCSGCGAEWEEYFDEETGTMCCNNCGKTIEVET